MSCAAPASRARGRAGPAPSACPRSGRQRSPISSPRILGGRRASSGTKSSSRREAHPAQEFIGSSFLRASGSAWSSPRRVSPFSASAAASNAGVGVDARGDAVAVWIDYAPTGFMVEAASARAGSERWSAPTALDGPADAGDASDRCLA